MPWEVTLVDVNNPPDNVTYTDANLEGLAYDDEPGGFRSIIGSCAKTLEYTNVATSSTSHNFTTGSKTFSIVGGFGFRAGSAVRVADVAGTSYMDGLVTSIDLSVGTVTVNVLSIGAGAGANGSWVITLGTSVSTIVATPVAIASGGTAGTTEAAARTNLGVQRFFPVLSVLSTPPGSPVDGAAYIVGSSPTGVFVGHEHAIALYTTGPGWTYTTAAAGDSAYDASARASYVNSGTAQSQTGIYAGSHWKPLTPTKTRWLTGGGITGSYTVVPADHGKWQTVSTASLLNITLPSPTASSGIALSMELVLEIYESNGGNTVITVTGGSNIRLENGTQAASITVTAGTYRCLHLVAGNTTSSNEWYVWKG